MREVLKLDREPGEDLLLAVEARELRLERLIVEADRETHLETLAIVGSRDVLRGDLDLRRPLVDDLACLRAYRSRARGDDVLLSADSRDDHRRDPSRCEHGTAPAALELRHWPSADVD